MKKYNKPTIEVDFIDLESICDAVNPSRLKNGGTFSDWDLAQTGTFEDLWK